MMEQCTWIGCQDKATFVEIGKDFRTWAKLCAAHHNQLEKSIATCRAPAMLSAWIKAQGGAKKAAERM